MQNVVVRGAAISIALNRRADARVNEDQFVKQILNVERKINSLVQTINERGVNAGKGVAVRVGRERRARSVAAQTLVLPT